jgi:RNA polymerase sigma-70 factor, ECF subfamily
LFNIVEHEKNLSDNSDEELMLRCKEGKKECLDILIERYKNPLYRYIFSMIREEAISEEIFQDVFLQVYNARRRYVPTSKFSTFVFKIAQNRCINEIRRGRLINNINPEDYHQKVETPLKNLLETERKNYFLNSLSKLPVKLYSAYVLCEIEGLSYAEIATIQRCSIGTVKSRISRARDRLCEDLKKYEL